jgi:hypothetical protein
VVRASHVISVVEVATRIGVTAVLTRPMPNTDGVSVKGCNIIYAPKGQAGEYAPLATNPIEVAGISAFTATFRK